MTQFAGPDNIGPASHRIVHERTRESIRAHTASSTTATIYAAACSSGTAEPTSALRAAAAQTARLYTAAGPTWEKESVTMDPGWLRMPDIDHHSHRDHRHGYLPGQTKGHRLQERL